MRKEIRFIYDSNNILFQNDKTAEISFVRRRSPDNITIIKVRVN